MSKGDFALKFAWEFGLIVVMIGVTVCIMFMTITGHGQDIPSDVWLIEGSLVAQTFNIIKDTMQISKNNGKSDKSSEKP